MSTPRRRCFTHQRLDAYQIALDLATRVRAHLRELPRGYGPLRNQLERSSAAVPLLIAEGANRRTWRDKRARFVLALSERAECDAALELISRLELLDPPLIEECRRLAHRIGAMLTRLVQRTD